MVQRVDRLLLFANGSLLLMVAIRCRFWSQYGSAIGGLVISGALWILWATLRYGSARGKA
jgi:hypothetical protein